MSKTKLKEIDNLISFHYSKIIELRNQREKAAKLLFFTCSYCKKRTRIGKLDYIQTY